MRAFLLTAGEGTRFRPQTAIIPKPALPFLNLPIICYNLFFLEQLGAESFVFNLHHLPEQMRKLVLDLELSKQLLFSHEIPEIMGTGGALIHASKYLKDESHFVVLNAEPLVFVKSVDEIKGFWKSHCEEKDLATLILVEREGAGREFSGVWVTKDRDVVGFGVRSEAEAETLRSEAIYPYHFTGLRFFSSEILSYIPDKPNHIFYDVLKPLLLDTSRSKQESLSNLAKGAKGATGVAGVKGVTGATGAKGCIRAQVLRSSDVSIFELGNLGEYLASTKECLVKLWSGEFPAQHLREAFSRWEPLFGRSTLSRLKEVDYFFAHETSAWSESASFDDFCVLNKGSFVAPGAHVSRSVVGANVQIPQNQRVLSQLLV